METRVYEKALALVERSFTGVLGTVDQTGCPYSKAMFKTRSEGRKEFWFCTNTSSRRVQQIQFNPRASLYFYDEDSFEGLMLQGRAEVSRMHRPLGEAWT